MRPLVASEIISWANDRDVGQRADQSPLGCLASQGQRDGFALDSPLEGSGFELVVPRHESPRFPDQRKQAETADTKPKRACLAAVTSARRRGYIAAVELDLAVGGYPGSVQRAVERADSKFKSHCDRWLAIEPRPRLFELRCQAKQRRLVSVTRDELNRDRESTRGALRRGVGPRQRQDDRRLAGQVEAHREGREVKDAAPIFMDVVHHHVDPPELRRQRRERWCEEDVIGRVKRRHLPAEAVRGLRRANVVGGCDLLAQLTGCVCLSAGFCSAGMIATPTSSRSPSSKT